MLPTRPVPKPAWLWPVVFVTALHLLSTAGAWWITDHGEILAVADRFLATGHLDLQDLGPGWENWTRIVAARGSDRTRFLPLSILLLTPFLALDHLAGWREPSSFRFVHLQGHFFVGLGLVLVGRFIARVGGNSSTTALSVLLLGLNWPVWMIARRLGPEPVLFALLAGFATGGARARLLSLLLLPWVHASGSLLGLGALLWLVAGEGSLKTRAVAWAGLGWTLGAASVGLLWNLPVHGHFILGGYNEYATDGFFTLRNPLIGALSLLGTLIAWTLPLAYLAFRERKRIAHPSLALWLPAVAFFGLFSTSDPERRLAPVLAIWTITVLARTSPLAPPRALGLALLSLASGVLGLSRDFVDVVPTPLGVFSGPFLLFLRLAFLEGRPVLSGSLALLLLMAIVFAGSRTVRCLLEDGLVTWPKRVESPRI